MHITKCMGRCRSDTHTCNQTCAPGRFSDCRVLVAEIGAGVEGALAGVAAAVFTTSPLSHTRFLWSAQPPVAKSRAVHIPLKKLPNLSAGRQYQ
jgi:hypothetical protein